MFEISLSYIQSDYWNFVRKCIRISANRFIYVAEWAMCNGCSIIINRNKFKCGVITENQTTRLQLLKYLHCCLENISNINNSFWLYICYSSYLYGSVGSRIFQSITIYCLLNVRRFRLWNHFKLSHNWNIFLKANHTVIQKKVMKIKSTWFACSKLWSSLAYGQYIH